jgi:subtilisin family serine protease
MDTFIVIPHRGFASTAADGQVSQEDRWKFVSEQHQIHRNLLTDVLAVPDADELLWPVEGITPVRPIREGQARSLDALGALLIDDLSDSQLKRLETAGAVVLQNIEVEGTEPVGAYQPLRSTLNSNDLWHLKKVGAERWHSLGATGKGTLIGVLDTGVDASHSEFAGKTIHFAAFDETGALLGISAQDYQHHGTHVCGTIAGNRCGIAPGASLAVAAVLTKKGARNQMVGKLAQVLSGINWLLQTRFPEGHIPVVNGSLSSAAYDPFCYTELMNARNILGTLFVAAIGNRGPPPDRHGSPGNYDCVIGVGATDDQDIVADFSDHGTVHQHPHRPKPDLCAPGVSIVSCVPGGSFATMCGTSMASPSVAGACSLLIEKDATLNGDAGKLENTLLQCVVPLHQQTKAGRGRLQL